MNSLERRTQMTLTIRLGDIGEEEPDTIELEPLPEEAPVPVPTPEPVPA